MLVLVLLVWVLVAMVCWCWCCCCGGGKQESINIYLSFIHSLMFAHPPTFLAPSESCWICCFKRQGSWDLWREIPSRGPISLFCFRNLEATVQGAWRVPSACRRKCFFSFFFVMLRVVSLLCLFCGVFLSKSIMRDVFFCGFRSLLVCASNFFEFLAATFFKADLLLASLSYRGW